GRGDCRGNIDAALRPRRSRARAPRLLGPCGRTARAAARVGPLMTELGLFPLGTVLLPTERIPLHIFELRYQELIGECLDRDTEFGLVFEDDDGMRDIGTRATVVDVLDRFDDGRLNIAIEGRERFRILAPTSGRAFLTAEVEPLGDEDLMSERDVRERALERFRKLGRVV